MRLLLTVSLCSLLFAQWAGASEREQRLLAAEKKAKVEAAKKKAGGDDKGASKDASKGKAKRDSK